MPADLHAVSIWHCRLLWSRVCLATYDQARGDIDSRRQRLAKLRGTPGIREERVSEAERDLRDAQQQAEEAKATYEVGNVDPFQF
jgi:sorting nexin-1/2